MTLLISVIIPVYNDQNGIDACLKALTMQTWPRSQCEIVVVDNGSTPPIRVDPVYGEFVHIENCDIPGSYAARNAGIATARGDVLAFTDADCVPEPDWIKAGVAALSQEDGRSIIGGEVRFTPSNHASVIERYQYLTGFMQRENIEHRGFSATANLFVTREQVEVVGPFNEKLLSGGDREWSWRAISKGLAVQFAADAVVYTSPRTSLLGAIRQARRVVGGRRELSRLGLAHVSSKGLSKHRSVMSAAQWIFTHPELPPWQRLQVFAVASLLKIVQLVESIRLFMGLSSERR